MELTEAGLKTILEEQREEYQRYLGVLSESFTSQVKLVAETLGGVQEQLISIKEMVAKNTEDIEVMKTDIMSIKHMLKQKVDQEEFVFLEQRVAALEAKRNRTE
jgi:hypothetical protein